MLRLLSEFKGVKPMNAEQLLSALHSNELWFEAVRYAQEQRDARTLYTILSYLHDKAYGTATKSVHVTQDVHHHRQEDLDRARAIAREILTIDSPTLRLADDIDLTSINKT